MKTWRFRFVLTSMIALGASGGAVAPSGAQTAAPAPPPETKPTAAAKVAAPTPSAVPGPASTSAVAPAPVSEPSDDPWEERKAIARENVEYLDALYKAKLAELREAELRNSFALALKTDIDRQQQKKIASTYTVQQTAITVAENQSQLEMRRVELKDVEIRLARARRRLKAVERSGAVVDADLDAEATRAEDRLRAVEVKNERLQREIESLRRIVDYLRLGN